MARKEDNGSLERVLAHLPANRRSFLRKMLAASTAAAALPMMEAIAQEPEDQPRSGKGKGGKGKGEGKGRRGKGKGKGKGKGRRKGGGRRQQ